MFIGACVGVSPLSASVSNVVGFNSGAGSSGTVTSTTDAEATPSGGVGSYTYSWELISSDQGAAQSIVGGSTTASPTFRATNVSQSFQSISVWRVTITDGAGSTATADCTVTLTWENTA